MPTKSYRIIDPCDRVQETKELRDDQAAISWLLEVRAKRHDPFLEIQKRIGGRWITIGYPPPNDFKNYF